MVCKILFFDFRKSEESFFQNKDFSNFDIKFFRESLNIETLENLTKEDIETTTIISVFISSHLDKNLIRKFKNLRIISTRSTGFDHIDVKCCVENNIALINVDSYGSSSVAQFAFCLMQMLVRNIHQALNYKSISSDILCGRNLEKLTLGVVGTGAIGMSMCKYAKAFGLKTLAYDILRKDDLILKYDVEYLEFPDLLRNSDIVALFIPYTNDNYHMFSYKEFEQMKDNSYFINVSRGEVVDTKALLDYAKQDKFSGIALDVVACKYDILFDKEKSSVKCVDLSKEVKELKEMNNVIITPHMAYNTQEAIDYILEITFEGIKDSLIGGRKYRVV